MSRVADGGPACAPRSAAAGIGAVFAAADAAWGQAAPAGPNHSSHAAGFFEELLGGRVWVLERPNAGLAADRNTVWAHYHAPDGTLLACAHLGGGYAGAEARWRVVPSRDLPSALQLSTIPARSPTPAGGAGTRPFSTTPRRGGSTTKPCRGATAAGSSPRAAGSRRAGRGR